MNTMNDSSVQHMAAVCQSAVTLAESHDFHASQAINTAIENAELKERTFRPSSQEEESWVRLMWDQFYPTHPPHSFDSNLYSEYDHWVGHCSVFVYCS